MAFRFISMAGLGLLDEGLGLLGGGVGGGGGGNGYNDTTTIYNGTVDPDFACNENAGLGAAVHKASVFLYSFTIEYSIIAGAMSFIMWSNIARRVPRCKNPRHKNYSFSFECGLLLGIICAMCGAIILVLNIVYLGDPSKGLDTYKTYHGYRTFMNLICLSACIGSFVGIYKGGWKMVVSKSPSHTIDICLLLLCVSGSFMQGLYTLIAAANTIGIDKNAGLIFFDELTHMIQIVMQCALILDAMHRRPPEGVVPTRTKQALMFLLVCNVTWWLLCTYELKGGYDIFPLENMYYGKTCWYVIVHLAGPFDILYRFHSTVMFFDVWALESPSDPHLHQYA